MPRRPRPVTYAEAMAALHDAYQTLRDLLDSRVGRNTREQLELLRDRLALVATRDDGRGRPHRRRRVSPSQQHHSPGGHD